MLLNSVKVEFNLTTLDWSKELKKSGWFEHTEIVKGSLPKKLDILWQSVKGWVGSKLKTWFLS